MKRVILSSVLIILSIFSVNLLSAQCTGSSPADYCFGTKIYGYQCRGDEYVDYVKGDCALAGMACKDAECVKVEECETNSDCNDNNPCTSDECAGGDDRRCENTKIQGCVYNDYCVQVGGRTDEGQYCSFTGELIAQKSKLSSCQNNYECSSNLCQNSRCYSSTANSSFTFLLLIVIIVLILGHYFKFHHK